LYQKLRRRSFENQVENASNGEMVGIHVQAMPCCEEEDAIEDTAVPEIWDADFSSYSSDEDHGPVNIF